MLKFTDISFQPLPLTSSLPSNLPQVPKHLFTASLSFQSQRYIELEIFRQQIEQSRAGLYHQPYTCNRQSVFVYKTIFFGLAVLFAVLGVTTAAVPLNIISGFFSFYTVIKGIIISLCAIFSFTSLTIALILRSEREAVLQCVRKARSQLASIYTRKRLTLGANRFFVFGSQRKQVVALKHQFDETYDRISEKKDAALHLSHRIATAKTIDAKEKEALLNQAIEELDDQLMKLVHTFRKI